MSEVLPCQQYLLDFAPQLSPKSVFVKPRNNWNEWRQQSTANCRNTGARMLCPTLRVTKNGRSHQAWNLLGQMGFPAITVPAGFTTHVLDRVRDEKAPGGTRLVGPVPAKLPVGIDFLAMPFGEPMLLRIASAYEKATHHRISPAEFGPLQEKK